MRTQYHSRKVGENLHSWDVHRLIRLSKNLPVSAIPLSQIAELDENWWYDDPASVPTPRSFTDHMVLVEQADLTHPIVLCAEGRLMDGMHRVVRALLEKRSHIRAVRFLTTPEPDYIDASVEDLPYLNEDI